MRTALEQSVLEFIRRSRMASPGDRFGVAVSGGADSVALLRLLESLRDDLGIALFVVHFDHMLRGADSDADRSFVAELARSSGLECVTAREDVRAAADEHGWNVEDAARRLRYAFFGRILREGKAASIGIAHTADDQAETVLGHLLRGTGLTGLAGIYPIVAAPGGGSLVRPLLDARRQDLRDYLRARGQEWREDATNVDQTKLRARIRARLLPVLESDFSPGVVGHLGDLARFAREEESFWSALVEDRLAEYSSTAHSEATTKLIRIRANDLLAPMTFRRASASSRSEGSASERADSELRANESATDPARALTERLIRRLYERVRGDRCDLSARNVEQVIRLAAESTSGKRVKLPGKIEVERVFDELVFSRVDAKERPRSGQETKTESSTYQYVVSLPDQGATTISVPEVATRFRLKIVDWPLAESDTESDSDALDAAALRLPLLLRNWRSGDAYRPRGHRQTRKLKQMFLAGRIPRRQRACWPVLESGGQVIWARGMAPAQSVCAHKGTRRGVLIEEVSL